MISYLNFILNVIILLLVTIYGTRHMTRVNTFMEGSVLTFNRIQSRIEELVKEVIEIKNILISTFQSGR